MKVGKLVFRWRELLLNAFNAYLEKEFSLPEERVKAGARTSTKANDTLNRHKAEFAY